MNTNTESIYDITEIPFFAYAPGLIEWVIFLALAAIVIIAFSYKRPKNRKVNAAIQIAINEISEIDQKIEKAGQTETGLIRQLLFRANLIVKRLMPSLGEKDISHFSEKELGIYVNDCSNSQIKEILGISCELEALKYDPKFPVETVRKLIRNLGTKLEELRLTKLREAK